ncbi:MAG TPA: hypothetical protein VGD42_08490 [Lysobacter sp.]
MAQRSPPHILCGALRGQGRDGLFNDNDNDNDNDTSKWIPAFAGMTVRWFADSGRARTLRAWIPAFAGMTVR